MGPFQAVSILCSKSFALRPLDTKYIFVVLEQMYEFLLLVRLKNFFEA